MSGKPSLAQGQERMNAVVREVHERQRELAGANTLKAPPESPADAWQRKFLSEGFGPDAGLANTVAKTASPVAGQQAQFMQDIKARAAEAAKPKPAPVAKAAASMTNIPMERPFKPEAKKKRGFWGRLFLG